MLVTRFTAMSKSKKDFDVSKRGSIMKAFAVLASNLLAAVFAFVLTSSSAQAMIPVPGSFVPSACGRQELHALNVNSVWVDRICLGEIAGHEGEHGTPGIGFQLNNGEIHIFKIVDRANLMMEMANGEVNSLFYLESKDGMTATMKVVQAPGGRILRATGTLGTINYLVTAFEPIFVIQRF